MKRTRTPSADVNGPITQQWGMQIQHRRILRQYSGFCFRSLSNPGEGGDLALNYLQNIIMSSAQWMEGRGWGISKKNHVFSKPYSCSLDSLMVNLRIIQLLCDYCSAVVYKFKVKLCSLLVLSLPPDVHRSSNLISFSVTDATTPKWQFLYFHWQVSRSFSFGHPSRGNSAEDVFPKLDLSVVIIADEQIRGNNNALLFPGWRAKWDDEWLIKRKWAFVNILSDN